MSSGNSRSSSGKSSIWRNKLHRQTPLPPPPIPQPPQPPPKEYDDGPKGSRNSGKFGHGAGYRGSVSSINNDYQPQGGGNHTQQVYEGAHLDKPQMSIEFPPSSPGSSRLSDGNRGDYNQYQYYNNHNSPQHHQAQTYLAGSQHSPQHGTPHANSHYYHQPRYNTPPTSGVSTTLHSRGVPSNARGSNEHGIGGAVTASRSSILFANPDLQAFNSSTFSPQEFNLPRPHDDRIIEQLFLELMIKRGWTNLPEQARRQMQAYPADKKWTLVHQDKLTEWQSEQKQRAQRNTGQTGAQLEGSPEWFVKKVLDGSITTKQLQSLSVSLRTQPIRYIGFHCSVLWSTEAKYFLITVGSEHLLKLKVKSPSPMYYEVSTTMVQKPRETRRRTSRKNMIL